ncbi:hypothetical protein RUND412_010711 [Rhizina undulata]
MASTSSAISQANHFLAPVLNSEIQQKNPSKDISLVGELYRGSLVQDVLQDLDSKGVRRAVIRQALSYLQDIHDEAIASQLSNAPQNPTNSRTTNALLDLIVLEGIYPSLPRGVGIPIDVRVRNSIYLLPVLRGQNAVGRRIQDLEEEEAGKDVGLLGEIIGGLMQILFEEGRSGEATAEESTHKSAREIRTLVRERCLQDILAGCGELAFDPNMEDNSREEWTLRWERLTDSISTPHLLPTVLSLLHPLTPQYFRLSLTKTLSHIPITRPHAVRDILHLFLSRASSGTTSASASSQLSIEALSKASQILGAVPKSVAPDEYFSKVCPQLLELLDGDDMAIARAAGFALAEMLGRRGAVEVVIEREIVAKILTGLNPEAVLGDDKSLAASIIDTARPSNTNIKTSSALLAFEDSPPLSPQPTLLVTEIEEPPKISLISEVPSSSTQPNLTPSNAAIIIADSTLSLSVRRIEILLSAHPTPSIPARLISPVVLTLWGLLCYAKHTSRSQWYSRISSIIKSYLATASSAEGVLENIQKHLLFPAEASWEFGPGSEGGIEIRRKLKRTQVKGLEGVFAVEERIGEFMILLKEGGVQENVVNEFFLRVFREWLQRRTGGETKEHLDPIKMLTDVKILQEIISGKQDILAKNPTQTLQIIKGVLDEFVEWKENLKIQEQETVNASLGGLGKIVCEETLPLPRPAKGLFTGEEEEEKYINEDDSRTQTVNMALSLLTMFLTVPSTKLGPVDERLISTLQPSISYISRSHTIDESLTSLATNISTLLSMQKLSVSASEDPKASLIDQQKATCAQALSFLRDPLVPVRAHGLHLLKELILARSPVIDIVSTLRLLITMLKDGDSFVYLNVIKCLSALTDRHSNTVTKMLIEAYIDETDVLNLRGPGEPGKSGGVLGLDERLRIGEALLGTVQRLGEALVGDLAEFIVRAMLGVISRRKLRIEEHLASTTASTLKAKQPATEEEGPEELVDDAGNPLPQSEMDRIRYAEKIVFSWPGVSQTEDLRIRTSALSILSTAIETNASGLPPQALSEAIHTSISILSLETAVEKGILRRAAVVCIGSFAKSLHQRWKGRVWGVLKERMKDLERVLGYIRVSDTDGLVREQAGVVGENFVALLEGVMVGGDVGEKGGGRGGILDVGTGKLGDVGIETLKDS